MFAAAADAGAATVWHSVLNLNEVAKESYFSFLRAEFPSLVRMHELHYRGKYAPKAVVDGIEERFRSATRDVRLRPSRTIVTQPSRIQLSLLEELQLI